MTRLPPLPRAARYRSLRRFVRPAAARPKGVRLAALLGVVLAVGLTAIAAAPTLQRESTYVAGRPSPADVTAPRTVTYTSELLTEQRRDAADRAVGPLYSGRDRDIAVEQRDRAGAVLNYVALIAANPYAFVEQKVAEAASVPELAGLPPRLIDSLVTLDAEALAAVEAEVQELLSRQLRQLVRPNDVPVAANSLVAAVDPLMDDATAELVAQLSAQFIVPNTSVDETQTEAARQAARALVEPVQVTYSSGQTIVHVGDPLSANHIEAMRHLGLLHPRLGLPAILGLLAFMTALVSVSAASLQKLRPGLWRQTRALSLAVLLILAFTFAARVFIPEHVVLSYAFPAAAVAMTMTVLLGLETGLITALMLSVSIAVVTGGSLEMGVYVLLGSIAGSVALSRIERFTEFLTAGAAVGLAGLAAIAAFQGASPITDVRGALELAAAAAVSATLATGLTALGALAAGALFGITTSIQLLELARPDHPLLRQLQLRAPGTYHHSILIGNLAEAAADAIGADVLLCRVTAYYHDVGKSLRPYFFIENQTPGHNPHDGLEPLASATIVIAHVLDGAELAAQNGLPQTVIDAIFQHHGTTRVEYFYHRAVELYGPEAVDEAGYRYPGPRPQTREMAILMLADVSEAAVRAANTQSPTEVDAVLERVFTGRLTTGQLDESELTLRDIQQVKKAFVGVFRRMYHPRIQYPTGVAPAQTATADKSAT